VTRSVDNQRFLVLGEDFSVNKGRGVLISLPNIGLQIIARFDLSPINFWLAQPDSNTLPWWQLGVYRTHRREEVQVHLTDFAR